jgi:tRNA(adenine34) deaminase
MTDQAFMRRAIDLARQAAATPGASPIGCVIVLDGAVIGEGHNEVDMRPDPTAHAEMVAIRRAAARLGRSDLSRATLYTTLQPCGMCTMASIWSKIGRVVFGAGREQVHRMYFEDRHLDAMDFITHAFRDDIAVRGGVLAGECAALYHRPAEDVPETEQANA